MIVELLGQYADAISGVSAGVVAVTIIRIFGFFKKDKYLLPFVNIAKKKAMEVFGKENVTAFLNIAKDVKVKDIPEALKSMLEKQVTTEKMLKLLLTNQIKLGVYDADPELKAEVESLL